MTRPAGLIKLWDASFAMGGPIKRDKLWFFANIRDEGNHTDIPGLYGNKFTGDASHWDYQEDPSVKARRRPSKTITSVRLTSQVTPRNKVSFYYDYQWDCDQVVAEPHGRMPVAGHGLDDRQRLRIRLLAGGRQQLLGRARDRLAGQLVVAGDEQAAPRGGLLTFVSRWGWMPQPGAVTNLVQMTSLVPTFKVYRGVDNMLDNSQNPNMWRASATYVTGAHNLKFGYQGAYHVEKTTDLGSDPRLILTDLGFVVPGMYSATIRIAPWQQSNRTRVSRDLRAGPMDTGTSHAAGGGALRPGVELVPSRAQRRAQEPRYGTRRRSRSPRRPASRATTTSRRAWAWRTTSGAMERHRSR